MKKFFVCAALAIAALGFTSCKDEIACWQIDLISTEGLGSYTQYVFGTREYAETYKDLYENEAKLEGIEVKVQIKKLNKTQSECEDANS